MRSFYATARGSVNEIRATPRRGECAAALARWLAVRNLVATGVAVGYEDSPVGAVGARVGEDAFYAGAKFGGVWAVGWRGRLLRG